MLTSQLSTLPAPHWHTRHMYAHAGLRNEFWNCVRAALCGIDVQYHKIQWRGVRWPHSNQFHRICVNPPLLCDLNDLSRTHWPESRKILSRRGRWLFFFAFSAVRAIQLFTTGAAIFAEQEHSVAILLAAAIWAHTARLGLCVTFLCHLRMLKLRFALSSNVHFSVVYCKISLGLVQWYFGDPSLYKWSVTKLFSI